MNHWGLRRPPLFAPGADGGRAPFPASGLVQPMPPSDRTACGAASAIAAGEHLLADAAERALRAPHAKLALALHLSRLKPPAPHPHHTRVALSLLQDFAERQDGHVFVMRNGDIVLLCTRRPGEDSNPHSGAPLLALPPALSQLFSAHVPLGEALMSQWQLETQADSFRAYIADREAEPSPAPHAANEAAYSEAAVRALELLLTSGSVSDLLAQQTAIHLRPGKGLPLAARITPLFRELTFSHAALTSRHDTDGALEDPFLFRHFAAQLDARMLDHVQADLDCAGRLTRPALQLNLPIHLNMTLESIVSPAFARLVQSAQRTRLKVAIEVSLMEACADPALMDYARNQLARAGFQFVLDGLDHAALLITHPGVLKPDLVKLNWSPLFADASAATRDAFDAAVARLGPERIVLHRAETEAALAWGQARGITRYQGFFLDAVQAASRIAVCHSARACSLRQCTACASTLNPARRAGCGNPGLLDMPPRLGAPNAAQ